MSIPQKINVKSLPCPRLRLDTCVIPSEPPTWYPRRPNLLAWTKPCKASRVKDCRWEYLAARSITHQERSPEQPRQHAGHSLNAAEPLESPHGYVPRSQDYRRIPHAQASASQEPKASKASPAIYSSYPSSVTPQRKRKCPEGVHRSEGAMPQVWARVRLRT